MANNLGLCRCLCIFSRYLHISIRSYSQVNGWLVAQEKWRWHFPRKLQKSRFMVVVYRPNMEHLIPRIHESLLLESFPIVHFYFIFRWFASILAADHLGIFSYWRVDILSGAGDNTNEDSDVWFYKISITDYLVFIAIRFFIWIHFTNFWCICLHLLKLWNFKNRKITFLIKTKIYLMPFRLSNIFRFFWLENCEKIKQHKQFTIKTWYQ